MQQCRSSSEYKVWQCGKIKKKSKYFQDIKWSKVLELDMSSQRLRKNGNLRKQGFKQLEWI